MEAQIVEAEDISLYLIPKDVPISLLDVTAAFSALTPQEKRYAHYIAQASWSGSLICLFQCSPESPAMFMLFQHVFGAQPVKEIADAALAKGCTQDEVDETLTFAAAFYGNMGNYKSFGDTKFVPGLAKDKMLAVLSCGKADGSKTAALWNECVDRMYSLDARQRQMGLGAENGISTYYSANCDEADAEVVGKWMEGAGLSPYNTRLFKTVNADGATVYDLKFAAAKRSSGAPVKLDGKAELRLSYGDHAPLMQRVVDNLAQAKQHAANQNQVSMLEEYCKSFSSGSIDEHKDASRHWIKDTGPVVESYIGFIESYRDPFGVRGEWEGFAAVVNKEMTLKFGVLVDGAEELLKLQPWPAVFEKDKFLRPDFTSLDVLAFGSSGIPAGINIPNYDDIRQDEGFKNVSLGNVLSARSLKDKVSFISDDLQDMYKELLGPAFEVQVGLHELLGHGSGKLFVKGKDGKFNVDDPDAITNPVDGSTGLRTFYNEGETWDSKFSTIASTYEECRAECTGLYLCLDRGVCKIFGHEGKKAEDIIHMNWLNMARAGLMGLEFYTPETGKWRQAHMCARYVILRVMLEAGEGFVSIEQFTSADGKPDLLVRLDASKIETTGKKCIGDFLLKLQVYKSYGDVEGGTKMYTGYSAVPSQMAAYRDVVLARKRPRQMMVQAVTKANGDEVELTNFTPDAAGMIESFTSRFPAEDAALAELYHAEKSAHVGA